MTNSYGNNQQIKIYYIMYQNIRFMSLEGRVFLHSFEWEVFMQDKEGTEG